MIRKSLLLLSLIIITIPLGAYATDCPYGLVNDPYPGQCSRYIDLDNNGICDLSQVSEIVNNTTNQTLNNVAHKTNPLQYFLPIIVGAFVLFYYITYKLIGKQLKRKTHRKFWDLLLLITYLFVAITGVILAITITFDMRIGINGVLSFWHLVIGIIMTLITIFHVHIYWHSTKKIFEIFKR